MEPQSQKASIFSFYYRVSNRRGGRNKQGGWQIPAKINGEGAINGQVGKNIKLINGEAGKNTTIRNFIKIKSSNDFVKIYYERYFIYMKNQFQT